MQEVQIHPAIRIVKREIRRWQEPVVGVVAREFDRDPFLILVSCLLSLRTKDKATREAKVAVEALLGQPAAFDNVAIPAVVFTDPEVAWCGLTETEAKR